ncbi:MAG: hypothetical protein WCP22_11420 [Chlamydiota bacterium]
MVSGPPPDRIDLHVEMPAAKYRELAGEVAGESPEAMRRQALPPCIRKRTLGACRRSP